MLRVRPFEEKDRSALETIYRECRSDATWLPAMVKEKSDFARDTEGEVLLFTTFMCGMDRRSWSSRLWHRSMSFDELF